MVTDSDLAFNNPTVHLRIDRSKANDLGITMADVGSTLALLVGENYVNRSISGASYEVIPRCPGRAPDGRTALALFRQDQERGNVPLSTVISVDTGVDPNALTQYNQLNSATFSAVPMPGITMGQAVGYLEQLTQESCPRTSTTTTSPSRGNMCGRAISSPSPSSSPSSSSIWCWRRSSRACAIRW
jgi:Cation/multidrug efflux pump